MDELVSQEASRAGAVGPLDVFIDAASDLGVSIVLIKNIGIPHPIRSVIVSGASVAVAVFSAGQSRFIHHPPAMLLTEFIAFSEMWNGLMAEVGWIAALSLAAA